MRNGFLAAALAALAAVGSAQSPSVVASAPAASLSAVRGSMMKLEGSHLLVGLSDGGLVSFDPVNGKQRFSVPGDGSGPVVDAVMHARKPWWVTKDARVVRTSVNGLSAPFEIDLGLSGLGPVRRLSVWQEKVVAHGDAGLRFIDPDTLRVLMPEEVLPRDVASMAAQGVTATTWKDGSGLFVVIRPYAARKNAKPGEIDELGMLTAWTAEWKGEYKLLGSYTADLVDFKPGPVEVLASRGPSAPGESPYATGALGNVKLGPEGIVALDYDEALTIPFYKDNWSTARITPALPPKYAQVSSYYNSDLWWADGRKLVHASLEDGSTDVFVPRVRGEVKAIVADEEGAWVMLDEGVRRIMPEAEEKDSSFVRYELGADTEKPGWGPQSRLAWVLKSAKERKIRVKAKNSLAFVQEALASAGVSKKRLAALKGPSAKVTDLQYGDVVLRGGQAAIYVGNGNTYVWNNDGPALTPLDLTPESRIHRFFSPGGHIPFGAHSLPIRDIGPVFPIGINKPNPRLGHSLFVRVNPNSPYDGPHLPEHYRMLSIIEDWQGVPYRWGGSTMDGTDCSGFVQSVYREFGINLPRHSQWMARAPFGEVVFDELRFGDVLVYPYPKHVAIYIGNGRTAETVRGGVGYSTVYRRNRAYVRRFLLGAQ